MSGEMTRKKMRTATVLIASVLAVSAGVAGCYDDPSGTYPYLHVLIATQQPESSNFGVVVAIQTGGGNYISLTTDQATVRLLPSADGSGGAAGACIPTSDSVVTYLLVTPTQTEGVLFADLYSLPSAPTGSIDSRCETTEAPVATSVTAVSHPVNPGAGSNDDAGEASEASGDGAVDAPSPGEGSSSDGGTVDSSTGGDASDRGDTSNEGG